jgi:hypothetical protein
MDNSRSSLINVDRANSTLFKRYLDEQHRSILKTSEHYQHQHVYSRPIQSTLHIEQQEIHRTQSKAYVQSNVVKQKPSNARKSTKPRVSHTSRFMRRFQRQYKHADTMTHAQKLG